MLTPQEFSKKRHERDLQVQEAQRQHRQKMIEAQQRQILAARQAAQQAQQQQQQGMGGMGGAAGQQQRPGSSSNMAAAQMQPSAQQQQAANMNSAQMSAQARQAMQMSSTRNGHLAVPAVNAQGIPQAQMRPGGAQMGGMGQDGLQRMAHANAQAAARGNAQYVAGGGPGGMPNGQPNYQMPSANMMSPGPGGMSAQQLQQSSQAMLATMQAQMGNTPQQQQGANHQMSASPNMPPPPAPAHNTGNNNSNPPQQLSSGYTPAVLNIKAQIRNKFPTYTEDQINQMATEVLKNQSLQSQSSPSQAQAQVHSSSQQQQAQARLNAMNAAAGINNLQAYAHNQAAVAGGFQMPNGNAFMNGDASGGVGGVPGGGMNPPSPQQYAALMRQRQMAQMRQSPNAAHATPIMNAGSPGVGVVAPQMAGSPGLAPQSLSPSLQYANMNMNMNGGVGVGVGQMGGMNGMGGGVGVGLQQRPPSRGNSHTPQSQMQRLGSSGNLGGSPQMHPSQGSPRGVQAGVAR